MKICTCKYAGLCSGAKSALDVAYKNLNENLYMYGEVLHNPTVISELKAKGAKIINSINEIKYLENKDDIVLLIRAHGVPKSVIDDLKENNIRFIDKTCPEVKKIHDIVYEKSQKGCEVIIVGNKQHPEVVGIAGWAVKEPIIIADINEAMNMIPSLENEMKEYCIVVQTTYNRKKYDEIEKYCKRYLESAEYFNTICLDTENRQFEVRDLSKQADAVIVIGGKSSSNSNKLYKIALDNCKNVQFIETYKELDFTNITVDSYIVIASGASTPENVIKEVKDCLHDFYCDMSSPLI